MLVMGLQGAIRGKPVKTTIADKALPYLRDRVNRQFRADQRGNLDWSIIWTGTAQYLSIRYTERLGLAGIEPSVGSVGDSYDNTLAETVNGLYKAEVIHRR